MTKTRETSLWGWLRDNTKQLRPKLHLQRIENICAEGTPDVNGFYGREFWVELKAVARTEMIDTGVDIEQANWARRRDLAGGQSWFLIQVGSGSSARRYLIEGGYGHRLVNPVSEQALNDWSAVDPSESAPKLLETLGI